MDPFKGTLRDLPVSGPPSLVEEKLRVVVGGSSKCLGAFRV